MRRLLHIVLKISHPCQHHKPEFYARQKPKGALHDAPRCSKRLMKLHPASPCELARSLATEIPTCAHPSSNVSWRQSFARAVQWSGRSFGALVEEHAAHKPAGETRSRVSRRNEDPSTRKHALSISVCWIALVHVGFLWKHLRYYQHLGATLWIILQETKFLHTRLERRTFQLASFPIGFWSVRWCTLTQAFT